MEITEICNDSFLFTHVEIVSSLSLPWPLEESTLQCLIPSPHILINFQFSYGYAYWIMVRWHCSCMCQVHVRIVDVLNHKYYHFQNMEDCSCASSTAIMMIDFAPIVSGFWMPDFKQYWMWMRLIYPGKCTWCTIYLSFCGTTLGSLHSEASSASVSQISQEEENAIDKHHSMPKRAACHAIPPQALGFKCISCSSDFGIRQAADCHSRHPSCFGTACEDPSSIPSLSQTARRARPAMSTDILRQHFSAPLGTHKSDSLLRPHLASLKVFTY